MTLEGTIPPMKEMKKKTKGKRGRRIGLWKTSQKVKVLYLIHFIRHPTHMANSSLFFSNYLFQKDFDMFLMEINVFLYRLGTEICLYWAIFPRSKKKYAVTAEGINSLWPSQASNQSILSHHTRSSWYPEKRSVTQIYLF